MTDISGDILQEASLIHQLLKGLMPEKKAPTASQLESKAKQVIEGILKGNRLSYHQVKKVRNISTGKLLRYTFTHEGISYVMKGFVAFDSGYMTVLVWDEDEQQVQIPLTAGYVGKEPSVIRAVGSNRLYAWLKEKSK